MYVPSTIFLDTFTTSPKSKFSSSGSKIVRFATFDFNKLKTKIIYPTLDMSASLQLEDNPTVHTMFHLDYQRWVVLLPVATFDVQFLTGKIESRNQTTIMSIFVNM